jgi:hypothetical protein
MSGAADPGRLRAGRRVGRYSLADIPFEALIEAATRAPSGDNTQPWRFVIDRDRCSVSVFLDEKRDPSPMNAGQRMARMACGAATENLCKLAQAMGWSTSLEVTGEQPVAVVSFHGGQSAPQNDGAVDRLIRGRVTNRKRYRPGTLSLETRTRLEQSTPELDGIDTFWITERERVSVVARVIGRADALMFRSAAMRRAFLANIRFDAADDQQVDEGLSLASLELTGGMRFMLQSVFGGPSWLFRLAGAATATGMRSRQFAESGAGLCIVAAPDTAPQTDFSVGRAAERAWLELTADNLAVQPLMSLSVLQNAMDHAHPEISARKVERLLARFNAAVPEMAGRRVSFLMRFGFAELPSGRTGRLPLPEVLENAQPSSAPAVRSEK